ncbi:Putative protein kinase [Septoria linicola]|uniref:Protein kinase domain-containing protein n=1 Tax=Septoria linicola TaxID=215465 RepID=A0A9Q9BB42_9PEZI|nr:putative protein kinase [Septoria linicola]USW59681.1 Putative protein kinase [Septoria linicola]
MSTTERNTDEDDAIDEPPTPAVRDASSGGAATASPSVGVETSFARLVPVNEVARNAFHEAVEYLSTASISTAVRTRLRACLVATRHTTNHDNHNDDDDDANQRWHGHYSFDLTKQTLSPSSWTFGADPHSVDFLLIPPSMTEMSGVFPKHGQFFQDQLAATLMVRAAAQHVELYLGALPLSLAGRLLTPQCSLMVSVLLYRLDFTNMDPAILLKQISASRGHRLNYPSLLSPTPSSSSHVVQDKFLVEPTMYGGAQGAVSLGFRLAGGPPIAAKRITVDQRNSKQVDSIKREIQFLKAFRDEDNIVHLADDFDQDRALFEFLQHATSSPVSEITLILEPAATHSLQELLNQASNSFSLGQLRTVATDWARGLAHIHHLPALHRDIKPANLGMDAFRGVVLDLGHMTSGKTNNQHTAGTISYLAPEIMALKRGQSTAHASPVSASSDLFSLGISVALWLLRLTRPPWTDVKVSSDRGVTSDSLTALSDQLKSLRTDSRGWWPGNDHDGDDNDLPLKRTIDTILHLITPSPAYRSTAADAIEQLSQDQFEPSPPPRRMLPFMSVASGLGSSFENSTQ